MYVENIRLRDFRNYARLDLRLSPGLNVFRGANAQGKTNLIEAVFFACVGRSPRTPRDRELIRWSAEGAYVGIKAAKQYGNASVETYIAERENKRVTINGVPIKRIGELMGVVPVVFFSPDELRIVKEGPSDRRKFLDIDLSQLSKAYFYDLGRFNKVLQQRNKLLKSGKASADTLHVWDVQLAAAGTKIVFRRKEFLSRLTPILKEEHAFLTDGSEELILEYEGTGGETEEEIQNNYLVGLAGTIESDLRYGHTSFGAHRDDFRLSIGGADIRSFGSQGQQRTAALALKLAELKIFSAETGEPPVLILDDVLSELDKRRAARLLERVAGVQTLITCTHFDTPAEVSGEYVVESGMIERV